MDLDEGKRRVVDVTVMAIDSLVGDTWVRVKGKGIGSITLSLFILYFYSGFLSVSLGHSNDFSVICLSHMDNTLVTACLLLFDRPFTMSQCCQHHHHLAITETTKYQNQDTCFNTSIIIGRTMNLSQQQQRPCHDGQHPSRNRHPHGRRRRRNNEATVAPSSITFTAVVLFSLVVLLVTGSIFVVVEVECKGDFKPVIKEDSSSELFEIAHEIAVSAPTYFPKPTWLLNDPDVVVVAEPTIGKHRPEQDVVMAYAEGYSLPYYMCFIETLRETGFDGDIVLAIASYDLLEKNVLEYLKTKENVVVYIYELHCLQPDGVTFGKRISKKGSLDIFQFCVLDDVYGWKDKDGNVVRTAKDPRPPRVVATLRYEWYWIWAQYYDPTSWIMLVDARDSFFQTNPFEGLPRNQDGLLYFFGENAEATRLGKSTKNKNWLLRGYGEETLNALRDKPTICSGSTMGEAQAIETYLRAMVNEWDETDCAMTGLDQVRSYHCAVIVYHGKYFGYRNPYISFSNSLSLARSLGCCTFKKIGQGLHNYLYYSGKLSNSASISKLVVWEQGKGIINNLGALRTKTFEEWGFYDPETHQVYNWDGTLSPVAHQWDRDKHLHSYYQQKRFREWTASFKENQKLE